MNDRLKIFFFESAADGTVGGSHSCMFNLIKYMDREKFDFTVGFRQENIYVRKFAELGIDAVLFPPNPVQEGFPILKKAVNWYRLKWQFQKSLEKFFRQQRFQLIVNNNSIWNSLDFIKVCGRLDIPLISYERGYGGFLDAHLKATAKLRASIPISRFLETNVRHHGFKTPLIRMIYDGINPEDMQTDRDPADIKRELNIPQNARVVGVIGNIRPWKGQRYFVEAFNELAGRYTDLCALVVGSSGSENEYAQYRQDLQQLVDPRLRGKRLFFLDYHEKIREILSILDVFVHTSIKPEPFGMVLLEAIAAKTPVVATNMGGPMEILDQGECGTLVAPKDSAAIAAACSRLLDNPALCRRLVDKSFDRLNRHFHIRNTVRETSELFAEIVDAGNACIEPPFQAPN
jgi:glycosyltransferase involved in cell wall biosynthesis